MVRSVSIFTAILITALQIAPVLVQAQTRAPGSILIRADGREVVFGIEDLAKLKRHEQRVTIDGASESDTVSGVLLWDLLQLAKIPSPTASGRQRAVIYLKLTGAEGQSAVIALTEIDPSFSKRAALVADRRNGKPLDTAEGPWRVFLPDDLRHARWVRGLVSVEAQTVK